jgi:molecular chaperone DnaK
VSAKDLGTQREQKITITGSTGLREQEIERMVKEAEHFSEEDRKRKELADARNDADNLIYSTEKMLKDLGDKVDGSKKSEIEAAIGRLREAAQKDDIQEIKNASENLTKYLHELSAQLYQQQAPQGAQQGGTAGGEQGDTVDAEYEVVDEDEKDKK